MYWSIYDTMLVVTGISSAAIAFVPGITNKARAISVAVGALLVVAALITGSLSSFTYPQQVLLGPLLPAVIAIRLWWAARKPPAAGLDPNATAEELFLLAQRQPTLRPAIAAHANAYPDLLKWLGALGKPATDAARGSTPDDVPITSATEAPDNRLDTPTEPSDPHALATDPATPAATLADLAYRYPALRGVIAANPAVYPELRDWIAAAGERAPDSQPEEPPRGDSPGMLPSLAVLVVCLVLATIGIVGTIAEVNAGGNSDLSMADTSDTAYDEEILSETEASGEDSPLAASTQPVMVTPRNVPTVLVLDASGSMVRDVATGGTRMEAARSATTMFVNGLSDGSQLGLTVFGTSTGNAVEDQAAGCRDVTTVLPVGPVNKSELSAAVASLVESGYTPIGLALQRAADQLPSAEDATIVLVSDGVDTCTPPPSCEIAATLKQAHPDLTIHTIGFLVDADEEAQAQLACIAAAGGGEFVEAGNAAQLAARLRIASDPDSLGDTVTPSGFNALRIGMTFDQARAAEPSLTVTRTAIDYVYMECFYATMRFRDGVLYDIYPTASAPTAEGLSIGDDLTRAVELYGEPTAEQTGELGTFQVFPATPGGATGYRVYYDGFDRVRQIVVCGCGPGPNMTTDSSRWQIDFEGIGPIKLGDSFEEAFAAAPLVGSQDVSYCTWYAELDVLPNDAYLAIVHNWDDPSRTINTVTISSQHKDSVGLPRTWAGVGIGSTVDEMRAAHPDATRIPLPYSEGSFWTITGSNGNSINFMPDDLGQVAYMEVSTHGIPLHEVCL